MTAAQTSVLRLVQAMFDAAPNAAILNELSAIVENAGGSVIPLANLLAENPVFAAEMYVSSLSNSEFAQAFIDNIVGDAASAANKALAVVEVTALLDSGASRGEVIALAADALGQADISDPVWGAAALQFQNKVLVAGNYAIDQQGTGATFDTLQAVTQVVTSDPASVAATIARFTESLEGVVVDGYVAGATVFVDLDGDGVHSSFEPSTTTDAQGNYSFPGGVENFGQIISSGGTDIATGQPFEGLLTAPAGSTVVNPLTTLIDQISKTPGATVASAKAQVLTALGLDSSTDLQSLDPIKTAADPNATAEQKALALKVQAAAAQVMTLVQQTAAVLKGTGTSADSNSASAAAFSSLADAISVASASAGLSTDPDDPDAPVSDGTLNLTSSNSVINIVKAAATRAGANASQQATVGSLADDASTIITNLTAAIGTAVGNGTGDVTETLNGMARVQVVSGNTATAVQEQSAGAGDISNAAANTSGDNLTDALDAAQSELGDVDGDGESNATTSSGGGGGGGGGTPTTFTVTETAGVVEFGGTASGNITVSWAGTVGDSVATFSRGGVTATEKPDFNGTATTITLAAGQTLALTAANATTLIGNITDIDGAGSVALTDNPVAAGDLNTLDTAITATINASAAATITGTGAEFATAIGSANITLSGSYAATVTGTPSIADLNTIDTDTSGVVTATPATATLATLNGLTGTGNAYTLTINDAGTVAASNLTTLDGKTTVAVDANSAATLSGTGAELTAALGSAGLSTDVAVALSVTGSITAAQQATFDGDTTGVITATISDGAMTALANLADANTNNALTVTVTDTSADAGALITLDGKTSVNVDATAVSTLTGTGANINTVLGAGTIDTAAAPNATVSDTISSTVAASLIGATGGTVTATVTSDTAANLDTDLNGLTGALTLTATGAANAADLNGLDTVTSVNVTASAITSLTGTAAEILTTIGGAITLPADVAITVTGTPSLADLNSIDAATTGVVTATPAADSLANLNGLNGTGNAYTLTLNDVGTIAATDLATLDGKTTVVIDATSAATLSGTGAELSTALGSAGVNMAGGIALSVTGSISTVDQATLDGNTTAAITATISDGDLATLAGLADANGNNALTVTVTDSSADAAALNTLDTKTSVAVTATAVNTITGTAAAAVTALAAGGLTLAADVDVTIDSGTVTSGQQAGLDGSTTGTVTATIAENDLASLAALSDANGNNAITVTVGDASAVAADLNALDDKTTVAVTATAVSTLTGSTADIITALGAAGLNLSGSIDITPAAGTMTAAQLTTIEAATTGAVDLSNITSVQLADLTNVNFEAASFDGRSLALIGTGNNGGESATVALPAGGATLDMSGIAVDIADVALTIIGNTGDDTITSQDIPTTINAGAGSDTITAGAGDDVIDLGAADGAVDTVVQAANDSADTGAIDDIGFDGGVFVDGDAIDITGADRVQNFEDGTDLISLSGAVSAATQDASDADGGVGVGEFTAIRGDFFGLFTVDTSSGADLLVLYDASGAGDIEMLLLPGAGGATFTAADFAGGGGPSFTVTETAGAVEFGGTATGNITVAWSATAGDSVATFTRQAVAAATTPDFSTTADTITLAAGQVFESDVTELTAIAVTAANTVDGLGTVELTDTTATAADLNALDTAVAATIDVSAITTLTGTAADSATALTELGLIFDIGVDVTLAAGSASGSDLSTVETNTTATIDMSAVTEVVLAAGDSFSFDSVTVTGQTFNLNGTGDNGSESFTVNLNPAGATVDLSNITVDENDVTVTVNGNDGDDTITATSADDVITTGIGSDTVVFADTAANNGADTLSDFATGSDKLDFSAFETAGATVEVTGSLTTTAGTVYYLTGSAAGNADSAASAATALSAAGVWTDADASAWIVISDDDSAAVYEWADTAASGDEVAAGELTLVGTITGTVAAGDLMI